MEQPPCQHPENRELVIELRWTVTEPSMEESIVVTGSFELSISLAKHQRKLFHPLSNGCVLLKTSPSMPTCISLKAALGRKLRASGNWWKTILTKSGNNKNKLLSNGSVPLHKFAFSLLPAVCACSSNIHWNKNNSELWGPVVGRLGQGKREAKYKKFSYYSWITSFVATTVLVVNASTYKKHIRRSWKK